MTPLKSTLYQTWQEVENEFKDILPSGSVIVRFYDKLDTNQYDSRPSDYVIVDNGRTVFSEVKKCNNLTSFPFSYLKRTQRGHANCILAAGGAYEVWVKHLTNWYCIPYQVIKQQTKKKSLTWLELEPYRVVFHD